MKANTKFTNHICLININVLKEIHIPCHPTYIISTNYILISNDMDKLGVYIIAQFLAPHKSQLLQNTRNGRFLFIKPNQLNTQKKNADCPSSSLPTSSSKLSTTHIQNSLSEENLSYSCKLIFNSLPCPPTPCYYLHSISHCTHIHPKTYQLPPST